MTDALLVAARQHTDPSVRAAALAVERAMSHLRERMSVAEERQARRDARRLQRLDARQRCRERPPVEPRHTNVVTLPPRRHTPKPKMVRRSNPRQATMQALHHGRRAA